MLLAISLNGLVISLLYFRQLENDPYLHLFDHFFVLLFLVEAIVKLNVLKPKAYFSNNWNVFDFFIVPASLPSLLTFFFELPYTSLLLILRLVRLVRLVRFLRFIPNLPVVLAGLGRALRSSVFVLFILMLLNFLLVLFTCHFYRDIAPEYFDNPLISSYTVFQMFTVEGWNEIPAVLAERMENDWVIGITRGYFVIIVLFGGIFGMSLANAVFVDEMTIDNNKGLENKIDHLNHNLERKIDLLEEQITELRNLLRKNV